MDQVEPNPPEEINSASPVARELAHKEISPVLTYSLLILVILLLLGGAWYYWNGQSTNTGSGSLASLSGTALPSSTPVLVTTPSPSASTSETLTASDVVKPANQQEAGAQLNKLQSSMDTATATENSDSSSLSSDFNSVSLGQSEESAANNL